MRYPNASRSDAAIHESGHAVLIVASQLTLERLELCRRGEQWGGRTAYSDEFDIETTQSIPRLCLEIAIIVAGPIAEMIHAGCEDLIIAGDDLSDTCTCEERLRYLSEGQSAEIPSRQQIIDRVRELFDLLSFERALKFLHEQLMEGMGLEPRGTQQEVWGLLLGPRTTT